MTQEEKAKVYDGLIERLKDLKFAYRFSPLSDTIEEIFPELREESEDERIRKWIIENIQETLDVDGFFEGQKTMAKESIAWLEKQSKASKVEQAMREVEEKAEAFTEAHKGETSEEILAQMRGEQKPIDPETLIQQRVDALADIVAKQKPAGKVEPKFKVGDKIYLKPEYRMPDDDTPIANTVFEIRVIDDKYYRFDGSYIFIEDQDKYELVEQKPAELPKGEDYGIDGLYAAIDILQKTLGKVDGYQTDDGILEHECAISAVKELSKQKPAWSEEGKLSNK